jgi:hypothetical protein
MRDRVLLKGDLCVQTLYLGGENGGVDYMEHEFPFSEIVEAPGVSEDSLCHVSYGVKDIDYTLREDFNGQNRSIGLELLLAADVAAGKTEHLEVISDCYAPGADADVLFESAKLSRLEDHSVFQTTLKEIAVVPEGMPAVESVCNVAASAALKGVSGRGGKLVLEGVAQADVLYHTADENAPISGFKQEIPFSFTSEIAAADEALSFEADVTVAHASYSLGGGEIELRLNLEFDAKAVRSYTENLIQSCELIERETAPETERPSIVVCFAQEAETLWDVAKRYRVAAETLLRANRLEEDAAIAAGQQILIPKA